MGYNKREVYVYGFCFVRPQTHRRPRMDGRERPRRRGPDRARHERIRRPLRKICAGAQRAGIRGGRRRPPRARRHRSRYPRLCGGGHVRGYPQGHGGHCAALPRKICGQKICAVRLFLRLLPRAGVPRTVRAVHRRRRHRGQFPPSAGWRRGWAKRAKGKKRPPASSTRRCSAVTTKKSGRARCSG